jgi:hypothetical protein
VPGGRPLQNPDERRLVRASVQREHDGQLLRDIERAVVLEQDGFGSERRVGGEGFQGGVHMRSVRGDAESGNRESSWIGPTSLSDEELSADS